MSKHEWEQQKLWVEDLNPTPPEREEQEEMMTARERGPGYYEVNGMQPWDVIDAFELDYYRGTALKYLLRAGRKWTKYAEINDAYLSDLVKAEHFIQKAIENEEKRHHQ